jgi:hypothetical protein
MPFPSNPGILNRREYPQKNDAGGNDVIRAVDFGVIDITAYRADVKIHIKKEINK